MAHLISVSSDTPYLLNNPFFFFLEIGKSNNETQLGWNCHHFLLAFHMFFLLVGSIWSSPSPAMDRCLLPVWIFWFAFLICEQISSGEQLNSLKSWQWFHPPDQPDSFCVMEDNWIAWICYSEHLMQELGIFTGEMGKLFSCLPLLSCSLFFFFSSSYNYIMTFL